jgi:hypothetical protein
MKKQYISPYINVILLDNEISLALESNPPAGPEESFGYSDMHTTFSVFRSLNS